jgi:hypothetical protein
MFGDMHRPCRPRAPLLVDISSAASVTGACHRRTFRAYVVVNEDDDTGNDVWGHSGGTFDGHPGFVCERYLAPLPVIVGPDVRTAAVAWPT